VAAVLSFFIPGLGQIYRGDIFAGFIWLIVVIVGYVMLILPGFLLHIVCIITATIGDPTEAKG
jgi:TM2 domain-containing membrane protein YozV